MLHAISRIPAYALRFLRDREDFRLSLVARRVSRERRTYLPRPALEDLYNAVRSIERRVLEGAIVEAGTALGGSALLLAAAKKKERPLLVFDSFEGMPPPSDRDGEDVHRRYATIREGKSDGLDGDLYYGYRQDLKEHVRDGFEQFGFPPIENNVHLIKGYYEDTLSIEGPVALAHIDCDWHDSVRTCLERIEPHLVPGGMLVIDDYAAYSGCRTAVDEYFEGRPGYSREMRSRLHIVKV